MRFLILFLLLSMPVMAEIDHILPSSAEIGSDLAVGLQLRGAILGERVLIGEKLPQGTTLKSWDVIGAHESKEQIGFYNDGRVLVWSFTAQNSRPTINYVITLPNSSQADFAAVYALPNAEIGQHKDSIALMAPTANVVVQRPTNTTPKDSSSWSWLIVLVTFIGLAASIVHYGPAMKVKLPRLRAIDAKKIEGEFSSWLNERIDHHKERIASNSVKPIISHPTPRPVISPQQSFQSMPQPVTVPRPQPVIDRMNAPSQPMHQFVQPKPASSSPPQELSAQAQSDNDALERLNASVMPSELFSKEIPSVSFDTDVKPLRPEDYWNKEERII